ncbi:subtilisin-serine protease Pr1 [Metarhizium humberi]|uniref:Subtilisin-serine protease Pr1 n=1 Tax=Metarhizium humberi TaxID=2596975 RepID=A0A9P8M3W0_9HYPO|nr:subtilisin-serine protease Pr1 [Metarhizium humberi]
MKYSMLSAVAVLTATSLGFPEFYWGSRSSPNQVFITNNMNRPVQLDKVTGKSLADGIKISRDQELVIPAHQTREIQAFDQSADLKLRVEGAPHNQIEVSYTSGDSGTYNYAIKPIEGGGFPGAVLVNPQPPTCPSQRWYPGRPETPQVTCRDRTRLQVYLQEAGHPAFEAEYDDGYDAWL